MKNLFLILLVSFQAQAETSEVKSKVLWDSWYTVKLNDKVAYGYYNDRVEIKAGQVAFKNQFWKNEEGHINEEQLVSLAKDDDDLTPVIYNFISQYRDSTLVLDGTYDGKSLSVKIRKDNQNLQPTKRSIPQKTFFSSLFPVWISKNIKTLESKKKLTFKALLEDSIDSGFTPVVGTVALEKSDDFGTKNKALKLSVELDGKKSVWYVEKSGNPVRIEMKTQNVLVERVNESTARNFLKK